LGSEAPGLSSHSLGLIAVIYLRVGSSMTVGLSRSWLTNVGVQDWSHHFALIVGDHRSWFPSSLARFLSPRVSQLDSIDDRIGKIRIVVEDPDELFGAVLEAARGGNIAVGSAHLRTFVVMWGVLWNSELCESVCRQLSVEGRY
jgi:hypothetical protein